MPSFPRVLLPSRVASSESDTEPSLYRSIRHRTVAPIVVVVASTLIVAAPQATPTSARNPGVSTIEIGWSGSRLAEGASSLTEVCVGVPVSPGTDIQSVIDDNPTGTTFCIKAGTYRLRTAIIPKSSDVLWGEPETTLNGSKLLTSFTRDGSYWVASGQTQQAAPYDFDCIPVTYTGCRYPEGVFYDDRSLRQETSLSDLDPGDFYFDYPADKIYLADDPTGHKVEASFVAEGIRGYGAAQANVTIKGLVVEKFANWSSDKTHAIQTGDDWIVEENEVRLNDGGGIKPATGSIVRGNNVHHNGRLGLSAAYQDNILIEGNEIAYNNDNDFDINWGGSGTKIWESSNVTFRNNYAHHNQGHGLRTDTNCINVVFEGNTVVDNTGIGIFHEVSYDATIRNNVVKNNNTSKTGDSLWTGSQIQVYDSPHVEIYGNIVEALPGTHGIGLRDDERGSGEFGKWEIRDVRVHDNLIRLGAGGTTGMVGSRNPDIYINMGNRYANNTYFVEDLSAESWRWGIGVDGFLTWAGWLAMGNDLTGELHLW
jgi:parallel beta-helix repeat protein